MPIDAQNNRARIAIDQQIEMHAKGIIAILASAECAANKIRSLISEREELSREDATKEHGLGVGSVS